MSYRNLARSGYGPVREDDKEYLVVPRDDIMIENTTVLEIIRANRPGPHCGQYFITVFRANVYLNVNHDGSTSVGCRGGWFKDMGEAAKAIALYAERGEGSGGV